jgi:hypothetical protein
MRGDIFLVNQLINSLSEAVDKLADAKNKNNLQQFNVMKLLVLDFQSKLNEELSKEFV